VCYDASGGGQIFRSQVSVHLAWWHSLKHAAHVVWSSFRQDVFGPLFHHLFPGGMFYEKPQSLPMILSHFHWIMMSYPDIRIALDSVIGMVELKANVKVAAQDLKFLCEFAIPVVLNCNYVPNTPLLLSLLLCVIINVLMCCSTALILTRVQSLLRVCRFWTMAFVSRSTPGRKG
jgi:hypothetical protein